MPEGPDQLLHTNSGVKEEYFSRVVYHNVGVLQKAIFL